jgi:hypothetical protein
MLKCLVPRPSFLHLIYLAISLDLTRLDTLLLYCSLRFQCACESATWGTSSVDVTCLVAQTRYPSSSLLSKFSDLLFFPLAHIHWDYCLKSTDSSQAFMYLSSDSFASIQHSSFPSFSSVVCAVVSGRSFFFFLLASTLPLSLPGEGLRRSELPSHRTYLSLLLSR